MHEWMNEMLHVKAANTYRCAILFARTQPRRGHICAANGFDFLNAAEFRLQQ